MKASFFTLALLLFRWLHHNSFHLSLNVLSMPGLSRNKNGTCEKCGKQTAKSKLWRPMKRCSTGTLHYSQYSNFSTTRQTHPFYFLSLLQKMTVEIWFHFSLTRLRCYFIINPSWKLEFVLFQVTNYKVPFKQFSP